MSATYEQRKAIVARALYDTCPHRLSRKAAAELAEAALNALDHIPEKIR